MDSIVRQKEVNLIYDGYFDIQGMYIFGKRNYNDGAIPKLPVIKRGKKRSFLITTEAQDVEFFSDDLDSYFNDGDILYLNTRTKKIRTILSKKSNDNTLLLTERCENRCLFCSQPPNNKPDSFLYQAATRAILNFNSQKLIGLTGGEPTYNKSAFLSLFHILNEFNNSTPLHILTNGRNLSDIEFFNNVIKETGHREIIWGVPLYGHKSSLHNSLVGSDGAFSETIIGLKNLSSLNHEIELRIVVIKQNYKYINNILSFINSAFPAIRTISIMNLEPAGFGRKNYQELYVPIHEQNQYLTEMLSNPFYLYRFDIRLLNYPLCLVDEPLRKFVVKSISDWKNYYPKECAGCAIQNECGGYFASSKESYIEKPKAIFK